MDTKRITVLGVPINAVAMNEAVEMTERFIHDKTPHLIATANAEMVMMAQSDAELADILKEASLVVPDGAGVVWAARYQGCQMPERVAGFDLVQHLLAKSSVKGYRIFMFGAAPGIAEKAKQNAEKLFPGLQVVGVRDGFFTEDTEEQIINTINEAKPDILLVALGVPKQEKWLARNLHRLKIHVSIGVGGTFDVMAGAVNRAPLWMQRANLEWLYRLLSQPKRAKRMLALPRFVLKVIFGKNDRQK